MENRLRILYELRHLGMENHKRVGRVEITKIYESKDLSRVY